MHSRRAIWFIVGGVLLICGIEIVRAILESIEFEENNDAD